MQPVGKGWAWRGAGRPMLGGTDEAVLDGSQRGRQSPAPVSGGPRAPWLVRGALIFRALRGFCRLMCGVASGKAARPVLGMVLYVRGCSRSSCSFHSACEF
jgi:hypothetical protein